MLLDHNRLVDLLLKKPFQIHLFSLLNINNFRFIVSEYRGKQLTLRILFPFCEDVLCQSCLFSIDLCSVCLTVHQNVFSLKYHKAWLDLDFTGSLSYCKHFTQLLIEASLHHSKALGVSVVLLPLTASGPDSQSPSFNSVHKLQFEKLWF